jgi:CRP-like cAMP-binding protein
MRPNLLPVETAKALLAGIGWLADCPADFVDALLSAGNVHHLDPGAALHHAGDAEGGIWGIARGQAAGTSGIGGPNATLAVVFMPGEWGGTGPMSGAVRQLDVLARTPTAIIAVPQWAINRLLAINPHWWQHFSRLHFMMVLKFGQLAADLQLSDSRARVAAILLDAIGQRRQGDRAQRLATTQEDVGRMANLSRYPAATILRGLAGAGMLTIGYACISVDQPAALRRIADGG